MSVHVCMLHVHVCACVLLSALKKLNEKKQVFNMYKTQKAKEEKVKCRSLGLHEHTHTLTHRRSRGSKLRGTASG